MLNCEYIDNEGTDTPSENGWVCINPKSEHHGKAVTQSDCKKCPNYKEASGLV
jgi:hypothetical protein